jgi:hypothetical protein
LSFFLLRVLLVTVPMHILIVDNSIRPGPPFKGARLGHNGSKWITTESHLNQCGSIEFLTLQSLMNPKVRGSSCRISLKCCQQPPSSHKAAMGPLVIHVSSGPPSKPDPVPRHPPPDDGPGLLMRSSSTSCSSSHQDHQQVPVPPA